MALWDKLKTELDRAGRAAQTAFDEGKVRLELLRLRQLADKAAQALGYAVYNARKSGGAALDEESYSRLSSTLAAHEAEIARLEAQLAAEKEEASQQRPATAQATVQDEPGSSGSTGTGSADGGTTGASGGTGSDAYGTSSSGTPPFSRPVSSNPGGVDPAMGDTGPSGSGGPTPPPAA